MEIPDNYGSVAFHHTLAATGELNVTTVGFHNTPIDDAATVAGTLATIWDNDMTAGLSDQWTFDGAYVLLSIGGVMQSAFGTVNNPGAVAGAPPSPAIAVGIKKETSYAGKKYRGRFYLPAGFLLEGHISAGGIIDAADVTDIQTQIDNVKADMNAGGYPMYLLHNDATAPTPIDAVIVRSAVRTQRRRQRLG